MMSDRVLCNVNTLRVRHQCLMGVVTIRHMTLLIEEMACCTRATCRRTNRASHLQ